MVRGGIVSNTKLIDKIEDSAYWELCIMNGMSSALPDLESMGDVELLETWEWVKEHNKLI